MAGTVACLNSLQVYQSLRCFEADMGALNAGLQKMSASYCIILKHVIQQFNPGGM